MENLFLERIEKNKKLFTKEELTFLTNNVKLIVKVYLLGLLDNINK